MRIVSNVSFVLAAALFGGCFVGESQRSDDETTTTARLSGAIFTTLADGSAVDANIYESKADVYLDGGPGDQAPASAAALPEGDYYFQVTDPSGRILLSLDAVECRQFHVNAAGFIDAVGGGACAHATGIDVDHGALTVQLMPYADTPNPGGVYKAWVTRVEEYDAGFARFHGFRPAESKTDNYKVIKDEDLPPPPPPCEGDACNPPPPPPDDCVCGDGNLDTGEQCDDGNTTNGDGCSSTCVKEAVCEPGLAH
jgi:cysteine-rich repeat protein